MINGGDFVYGVLSRDEVDGEAFEELRRRFLAWDRPRPLWPDGTRFELVGRTPRIWSSPTAWAILPCGVRYELLLTRDDDTPDPREVPPICWSVLLDPNGTIYAEPRVANMKTTLDPPHPVDSEKLRDAHVGVPLGLERRYRVGMLSRPLREKTQTVSLGWGYG